MKMTQFAKFANNATNQILGVTGLQLENLQSMFSYPNAINVTDPKIVSGNVITIDDGAPLYAKRLTVFIEVLQAGSGDPSPDNIRTITGWDVAKINVTGRNIFDNNNVEWIDGTRNDNGVTVPSASARYTKIPIKVKPSTRYTISGNPLKAEGNGTRIYFLKNNYDWISRTSGSTNNSYTFITPPNCSFIQFQTTKLGVDLSTIQIEEGQIQTDYESFGNLYTIIFPNEAGTVYGGVLDVVRGILTLTKKSVNLGTITYTRQKITDEIYIFSGDISSLGAKPLSENGCCSIYTLITGNRVSGGNNRIGINTYGTRLFVRDDRYTDASAFKQAINNEVLVYELNEPITVSINPTDILMLDGVNNVFANCGSIELEYYRRESGGNPYV